MLLKRIVLGSVIRLMIDVTELSYGQYLDSDTVSFDAVFFVKKPVSVRISKSSMVRVDENRYMAFLDTTNLTAGPLVVDLHLTQSDPFEDNRQVILRRPTGVNLIT